MRTIQRKLPSVLALLVGLTYTYHSSGQHVELADLGGPARTAGISSASPISDDGRDGDALVPADQLLITFTATGEGERTVEVLDEQGRTVLAQRSASEAGRTLIPVDVTGLAQGRYAVRVQEGGATRISRFVRE